MDALFDQLQRRLEGVVPRPLQLPGVVLRPAAVLVPLLSRDGALAVVLTKRPLTLRNHAGQISFPGGGADPSDATRLHTALRETHEELGIPPERVRVLGRLEETPTITQYAVQPFVGVVPPDVRYVPSEEVEQVIEVPMSVLLDPTKQRVERFEVFEAERDVYFFDYGEHVIWGATARILRNLLDVAGDLFRMEIGRT